MFASSANRSTQMIEVRTQEYKSSSVEVRIVPRALAHVLRERGGFYSVVLVEIETREVM
jgi:hypothetical protein